MILFNETKSLVSRTFNSLQEQNSSLYSQPLFKVEAAIIRQELQKWSREKIASKFKIKGKTLETTIDFYQGNKNNQSDSIINSTINFTTNSTTNSTTSFQNVDNPKATPAITTYSGIGYQMLNSDILKFASNDNNEYLKSEVYILSAMYGLLNAMDLIEKYRLDFTVKVFEKKPMTLYKYWESKVNAAIIKIEAKQSDSNGQLLLLASGEYLKVVNCELLLENKIDIYTLQAAKSNKDKLTSMDLKKIRGILLNACIEQKITDYQKLDGFSYQDIFKVKLQVINSKRLNNCSDDLPREKFNSIQNNRGQLFILEIHKNKQFPLKNKPKKKF